VGLGLRSAVGAGSVARRMRTSPSYKVVPLSLPSFWAPGALVSAAAAAMNSSGLATVVARRTTAQGLNGVSVAIAEPLGSHARPLFGETTVDVTGIPHRCSVRVADPPRTVDELATPSIVGENLLYVLAITPSRLITDQF
jgi:small neutral amino acid transporter SnatA (MarC family)